DTGKTWSEWKSPVAKLFRNFQPSTRAALAAEYQRLFQEAQSRSQGAPADAGLDALRQLLHEKFGPFRAPADAKRYYPSETQQELARLEQEEKELEATPPDFPRAMGVCESGAAADLPIHIRGSHWTLGPTVPRRFLRAISGENQPPIGKQASGRL